MKTKRSANRKNSPLKSKAITRLLFVLVFAGAGAVLLLITRAATDTHPVYRLYHPSTTDHLYTTNPTERDNAAKYSGYSYEGINFYACSSNSGGLPVYRIDHPGDNVHHFTTNYTEYRNLISAGWTDEGIGFYACPSNRYDSVPVYRIAEKPCTGCHLFTISSSERDTAVKNGWTYEGIGWYGSNNTSPPPPPPQPKPSPTPPPPTPTPSPPNSGGTSSNRAPSNPPLQSSGAGSGNASASISSSDSTPPSTPTNFQATSDSGKPYVALSWEASTDDTGISGYELERSLDQQAWTSLQANFNETSYTDSDTLFNTHYFYRIRAIDTSNNYSDYTTADVTTPGFSSNAFKDKDSELHSDKLSITISIPAGALSDDAQCDIATNNEVLSPDIDGYKAISGPYQVICKKGDGSLISQFTKPLRVQWKLLPVKGISKFDYYGYNNKWQHLTLSAHDSKKHIDTFELSNGNTFVAMGKIKHTSPIIKIVEVLLGLAVIVFVVLFFLYRRYRSQQVSTLSDYLSKIRGG